MQLVPSLAVCRFAQLSPGDLFLFEHSDGKCVGFAVEYKDQWETKRLVLPLGPIFPKYLNGRQLFDGRYTVVSFGTNFCLRLPSSSEKWSYRDPEQGDNWIAVAGDKAYFIGNCYSGPGYLECFFDISTGSALVNASSGGPSRPSGIPAFAMSWELVTTDDDPKIILQV